MALITQGTTITKVSSGGTEIKKVLSGGTIIWTATVMRTITIPTITGVSNQTLKIGETTIYNGAGGTSVQVEHGSIITIQATATAGYFNPSVTSPVTANADFSTASYITAGKYIITITIPTITNITNQQLVVNSETIYSGAGGTTKTVGQGDSVYLYATGATGYNAVITGSPVTASSNFSTSSYISAQLKTYTISYPAMPTGVSQFTIWKDQTAVVSNPSSAGRFNVNHGDTITANAGATTGYEVTLTGITKGESTTVTSNINIGFNRKQVWTVNQELDINQVSRPKIANVPVSGLAINKDAQVNWTIQASVGADFLQANGTGTISSTTDSINAQYWGAAAESARVNISIIEANKVRLEVTVQGASVSYVVMNGTTIKQSI